MQSKRIKGFMNSLKHPIILCGDFNLNPDTQSMRILDSGMNNMIALHHISSTRTSYYPKAGKFADYIITSPEIKVSAFKVMPDEVSDHAPLYLDFELKTETQHQPVNKIQSGDAVSQVLHTKATLG